MGRPSNIFQWCVFKKFSKSISTTFRSIILQLLLRINPRNKNWEQKFNYIFEFLHEKWEILRCKWSRKFKKVDVLCWRQWCSVVVCAPLPLLPSSGLSWFESPLEKIHRHQFVFLVTLSRANHLQPCQWVVVVGKRLQMVSKEVCYSWL